MKVCRKKLKADKKQKTKPHQANIVVEENNNSDDDDLYNIYCIQQQANPPIKVKSNINNKAIIMEADTGAYVSLMNASTLIKLKMRMIRFCQQKASWELTPTTKGEVKVNTEYKDQSLCIPVIITENGPNLLGRDVLKILQLNWFELFNICNISEISAVYENESLKKILPDYKQIFKPELRTLKGVEITLHVDPDAKPCFFQSSPSTICPEGQNQERTRTPSFRRYLQSNSPFQMGCPHHTSN